MRPLPADKVLAGAFFGLMSLFAGLFAVLWGQEGWSLMSRADAVALGVFGTAAAVLLCAVFLRSIHPGAVRRIPALAPFALLVLGYPALVFVLFPAHSSGDFVAGGIHCLKAGMLASVVSAVAAIFVAKRGYVLNGYLAGAAVGGFGGLVAAISLQIACPALEAIHLAVWHGLTIALSVGAGALAGGRAVRA